MSFKVRSYVILAWLLIIVCLVGWPTSLIWWAKNEPPLVVSLSWAALLYTAFGVIVTVDIKRDQEDDRP